MTPSTNLADRAVSAADWGRLAILSLLWGGSFLFYKLLAPVLPPLSLVAGRVGLAALVLGSLLAVRRALPRFRLELWGWFVGLGTLNCTAPFVLFAWSEHHVSSGTAALLNAPTPVATAIAAHFLTRDERLTARTLAGAAFALAGVTVLVLPGLGLGPGGAQPDGFALLGDLACLMATACYAVGGVLSRRLKGLLPLQLAFGQLAGATASAVPLALVFDRPWRLPPLPLSGWLSLGGIGLLSTALAYLLYFRILVSSGATRAALVTFLVPVGALLLGLVVLGERPSPLDAPAIVLIGIGLAVIDGRLLRRFSAAERRPARP